MATLNDILSPVWTMDKSGGGQIVEGLSAIRQALDLIISTTKGSDPLRPEFGCDANKYLDYPVNIAAPLISKALLDAISTWETRVTISSISYKLNGTNNLVYTINYTVNPDIADELTVNIANGVLFTNAAPKLLTLTGLFPPNPNEYAYSAALILNSDAMFPQVPSYGFEDIYKLYSWVVNNWSNYGRWFLTVNGIIGLMNPEYTSGTLTISIINIKLYAIPILPLQEGNQYSVRIIAGGVEYDIAGNLYTADDILNAVQQKLSSLGTWTTQNTGGDFNEDFDNGFNESQLSLVLQTQALNIQMSIAQGTTGDFNEDFNDDFNTMNISLRWSI